MCRRIDVIGVTEYLMTTGCWAEDRRDTFDSDEHAVRVATEALDAELASMARLKAWSRANPTTGSR